MKSKVAAALATLALVLTGCGSDPSASPSSSSSVPATATLKEWITAVGVSDVLNAFSESLKGLSADVTAADPSDPKSLAGAIAAHGPELLKVAVDLAAEPACDDSAYEALRTSATFSIRSFAKLAIALSTTTDAKRMADVNAAVAAITPMNAALQPYSAYITAHGTDTVHAAA